MNSVGTMSSKLMLGMSTASVALNFTVSRAGRQIGTRIIDRHEHGIRVTRAVRGVDNGVIAGVFF